MQSCPRPWVIMKLTISGVTFSAAQMKSPSFSRSSASMTMTISPRPMASTAASMLDNRWDTLFSTGSDGNAVCRLTTQYYKALRRRCQGEAGLDRTFARLAGADADRRRSDR